MLVEGLRVPILYNEIESAEEKTSENNFLSYILGWCVDLLNSSMQINDDILDGSDTRWDYPCLYKQNDIKFQAVNDAALIENLSYIILNEFCSKYPWYTSSMNLMHTVSVKTSFGQALEEFSRVDGKPKFELYTIDKYNKTAKYRLGYIGILLPAMFATYCTGKYDDMLPIVAEDVFAQLGIFVSVQDDMVDDQESRLDASLANDISVGKCTWLVVQALSKTSPGQKELIYRHYGKSDPESVSIIHNLYDELYISDLYEEYKKKSFQQTFQNTKNLDIIEPHKKIIYKLIHMLYE